MATLRPIYTAEGIVGSENGYVCSYLMVIYLKMALKKANMLQHIG